MKRKIKADDFIQQVSVIICPLARWPYRKNHLNFGFKSLIHIQRSMFSCLRSSAGEIDECGVAKDLQLVL